jgi:two-component system chemotaxis sensor kinase CheA
MSELDDVVKEFLVESYENLDQLDRDLVSLEQDPTNRERLASIFRTIHTIKGTCGFFGFSKLESVAHVGENLLSKLRDGVLTLDPECTSALLAMVDAVRAMLASIESAGNDGENQYSDLVKQLTKLQDTSAASKPAAPAQKAEAPKVEASKPETPKAEAATPAPAPVAAEPKPAPPAPKPEPAPAPPTPPPAKADAKPAAKEGDHGAVSESTIRVDVGLLDKLMNLVGELVLARNQVLQFNASQKDAAFLSTSQRLNLITTELQEGVMKTRMQPIGNIWNKFPRVVRDLAMMCGKQVRIEMEGKETELDKTIIEAIKDPLTHLVRNSVDHGIEKPETRTANGKSAEGMLLLRAYHEGGQVNIEIIDDGGGLNVERIKNKGVERGLITRDQAQRMNDREAGHLIFLPGFSTAEQITNVSGRGVGMDVVKTNIEKIGGTVDIQSTQGHGTTIKIKIPLTLAIIPALMVTSGGDRYAIPQVSLLELVRLEGEQARKGIERIHGAPVYRLRGNLLPLVYLNKTLEVESKSKNADTTNIVVLQADDRQFGLVVDPFNDTEEIVVKPLGKLLKGISVFAGATIMGDGRVALILDVLGIAQSARVISEVRDRSLGEMGGKNQGNRSSCQTLLLVGLGKDRRMSIPLSLVARLEEIPRKELEVAEGQEVVQYRGQILPLIRLSSILGVSSEEREDYPLQVVVYSEHGRSAGLVVDRILDIVETNLDVQRSTHRSGIMGSAVIQNRVTDVLDLPAIMRQAEPTFFETTTTA